MNIGSKIIITLACFIASLFYCWAVNFSYHTNLIASDDFRYITIGIFGFGALISFCYPFMMVIDKLSNVVKKFNI